MGVSFNNSNGENAMYLDCVPAYGRDYKSQKEVKQAWEEGKDFQIVTMGREDGRMINKQDAKKGMSLMIRFKQNRNVCVIDVK